MFSFVFVLVLLDLTVILGVIVFQNFMVIFQDIIIPVLLQQFTSGSIAYIYGTHHGVLYSYTDSNVFPFIIIFLW